MSKLVLIDGHAIMHRAFHALPKTLTTRSGEPINAVYGFVSMLLRIIVDLEPTHIALCFDRKEPTFRHEAFEGYQAHRPETDKQLSSQFAKAKDVAKAFGIPIYEKAGFEADDIIGTIANLAVKRKKSKVDKVVIVTGDRDILQLVTSKIKVYLPIKGLSHAQLMGPDEVYEKFKVRPDQVDEYKALVGDPSDNYKGVPGIGPKTAEKLLNKYNNLDEIYSNIDKIDAKVAQKLKAGKKSAQMSQKLAQIVKNVPIKFEIEKSSKWSVGNQETIDLFKKYGFKSLTKRVIEFKGSVDFKEIILLIVKMLKGHQYAIRGTASLVLQGIDMNVDDIDVIADRKTALACNKLLKKYLIKKVKFKSSDKFKSYFGEFAIKGMNVEIMGEWQIMDRKGNWSKPFNGSEDEVAKVKVKNRSVIVTKIQTELSMFAMMGRWNAYHKINKQIEKKETNQQGLF